MRLIVTLLLIYPLFIMSCEEKNKTAPSQAPSTSQTGPTNPPTTPKNPEKPTITPQEMDPLFQFAWHLKNTGQTTFSKTPGTLGMDIQMEETLKSTLSGKNINVLVSDNGTEGSHEDIIKNYHPEDSKKYPLLNESDEGLNHGTAVAGIIGAMSGNGIGSRGVAPFVKLADTNFISASQTTARLIEQAVGDFHVFNYSWGYSQGELTSYDSLFRSQIKSASFINRNAKGSLFTKAAGNDFIVNLGDASNYFLRVGNINHEGDSSSPYLINVAALNANGIKASYSSPGSAIWISAPGGEFGDDHPAILTTDRMGCEKGYSLVSKNPINFFEYDHLENKDCNYTSIFNGTSSATPILTGALALILEVNPNLTWRDIKHILASTSVQVDADRGNIENPIVTLKSKYPNMGHLESPSDHVWEQGWITNRAGYKFHNWYGFGSLHVDKAIQMAKTYNVNLGAIQETVNPSDLNTWVYKSEPLSLPIPDYDARGIQHTLRVNHKFIIEAVQIRISITHNNIGDLGIELTSPSGTKSILTNINNALFLLIDFEDHMMLSNAFYGEKSEGDWKIRIIDGAPGNFIGESDNEELSKEEGSLTEWGINIIGHLPE